jgi:hypothetical protein
MPTHSVASRSVRTAVPASKPAAALSERQPVRNPLWHVLSTRLQPKLTVNQPGDSYEREADRVADEVMRIPEGRSVQRMCAACEEEIQVQRLSVAASGPEEEEEQVQTKREVPELGRRHGVEYAPPIVDAVLQGRGEPLDGHTRQFMESRFLHNFAGVRVHVGDQASASARAVRALAYTVGHNIVFGSGQFAPSGDSGRRLLAHELTHVIQQTGGSPARSTGPSVMHRPPGSILSRQNTAQTASVLARGAVASVQFILEGTMNSTAVGPVSGQEDVSAIAGRLTTIRELAQVLLPLWNSATPFTPAGSTAPVAFTPLTADELAKGLLVYNRYRLAIPPAATPPVMTNWKIGMRFRLPIRIDAATNEGILHPDPIRSMAGTFDPAWTGLLDQLPAVLAALPAADLTQAVTDFLAHEPSTTGRGIHLGARAVANAQDSREFILEALNQVGAGAFDLALAFMDFLVNSDISLLAAQEAGAAILARIQTLLAAPPATATPAQQASVTRATGMLGRVAGVQARPEPCIPNRQLTWANFTGTPTGAFEARTQFRISEVAFQGGQLFQTTLDQGGSWVRPRSGQPSNLAVNGCQPQITACEAVMAPGTPGVTWGFPGGPSTTCPAAITVAASTATNFGECTSVIGAACTAARVADSPRLLRHEQLHFDIPCVLVHKANAARAAGTAVTLSAVRARANTLTNQYDTQTNHGCNPGAQATWEQNVGSGQVTL